MKRHSGRTSRGCARPFRLSGGAPRPRQFPAFPPAEDEPAGEIGAGTAAVECAGEDEDADLAGIELQDVAEHAGVSISTVSNVINGRTDRMLPSTFHRVNDSIRALNYHPNAVAQAHQMKVGHSPLLGLLVPSIANPFFGSLAREIDLVAQRHGYRLLLGNTYRDPETERELMEGLMSNGVRAIITASSFAEQSHYVSLVERGLTIVSFDRRAPGDSTLPIDYVSIDNFHAGYAATQHLIESGHTSIAYVTAPAKTMSRIDRREGYLAAMKEAGLSRSARVHEQAAGERMGDSEMAEVGRAIGAQLAKKRRRPTALVAMSDMVAIGLIAGLHEGGIRVPHDVSIVGIDDLYLDSLIVPAITSIRQPLVDIAEEMIDRILKRLANPALEPTERLFKPLLIGRDSVRVRDPRQAPAKPRGPATPKDHD